MRKELHPLTFLSEMCGLVKVTVKGKVMPVCSTMHHDMYNKWDKQQGPT